MIVQCMYCKKVYKHKCHLCGESVTPSFGRFGRCEKCRVSQLLSEGGTSHGVCTEQACINKAKL